MQPQPNTRRGLRSRAARIPQKLALRCQLITIAGNEPKTSNFEIRPLHPGGGAATHERAFVPVHDIEQAIERILRLAPRFNVYVGAAPRVGENGTAAGVEHVWCLWSDIDSAEALAALRAFEPRPSIVVRSGSGDNVHAWWPLREPLPAAEARRANRRLALALGADMAATDAARILRPVGSLNHKAQPASRVEAIYLDTKMFQAAREVVGSLPDPPDTQSQGAPATCRESRPVDGPAALDGLARTVATAQQGNRNNALHWAACRAAERIDADDLDPMLARSALRDAALAAGLGEHEIEATLHSALDRRAAA